MRVAVVEPETANPPAQAASPPPSSSSPGSRSPAAGRCDDGTAGQITRHNACRRERARQPPPATSRRPRLLLDRAQLADERGEHGAMGQQMSSGVLGLGPRLRGTSGRPPRRASRPRWQRESSAMSPEHPRTERAARDVREASARATRGCLARSPARATRLRMVSGGSS